MSLRLRPLAVGLALACVSLPAPPAQAQAQPQTPAQARAALRCESDGSYQRCPSAGAWRGARLVRQLSSNPCIQGRTWGFEPNAIWVNHGCRGEFDAGDPFANAGERVTCAGSGRTECPADTRYGVTLVRKLSQASCIEGSTWGHGGNAVWVDRGCRAEFQIGSPPSGAAESRTEAMTCGSTTGQQVTCPTDGYATGVRMTRDLSNGRCRQNQTWGHTNAFLWATRGCRAEFLVTLRGEPAGQTGPTVISCGTTTGRQVVCETEGVATAVTLQQDRSGGRCRQGQSWGYTESFIWASQGCRGEFAVTYRDEGAGGTATRRVTCGTADAQRLACRPGGRVATAALQRQLSAGRCRQGSTWGYAGDSLWVANGCVAEFTLTVAPSGSLGPRTLSCGSVSGQRMTCDTQGRAADVRLVSDLSGGRCREGQTWGHTEAFIWANQGCRGRFEIRYAVAPPRN